MNPKIALIAAVAENGVIGANNKLPWRLPADLKHFRGLTTGHYVLMGRKTCESLGRSLPYRTNIVVTSQPDYASPGYLVARSIDTALEMVPDDDAIFVIGGASLYTQLLPQSDYFYLTQVHADVPGDMYFPEFDRDDWRELDRQKHCADDQHVHSFSFITLKRKRPSS